MSLWGSSDLQPLGPALHLSLAQGPPDCCWWLSMAVPTVTRAPGEWTHAGSQQVCGTHPAPLGRIGAAAQAADAPGL